MVVTRKHALSVAVAFVAFFALVLSHHGSEAIAESACECDAYWSATDDSDEDAGEVDFTPGSCDCPLCHSPTECFEAEKSGSVTGSEGSYSLVCSVTCSQNRSVRTTHDDHIWSFNYLPSYGYEDCGQKSGHKKFTVAWNDPSDQHDAPGNATWTAEAVSDVVASATWRADNSIAPWIYDGNPYVYVYVKAEISGVASDEAELEIGGSLEEGEDAVDVTVGPIGLPIPTVSSDVGETDKTTDASVNTLVNPVAVGQNLKVRGKVRGRAKIRNSAEEGSCSSSTDVTTYVFDLSYGGTHDDCPEGDDHEHTQE